VYSLRHSRKGVAVTHQSLSPHGLRFANPSYRGFIFNCTFLLNNGFIDKLTAKPAPTGIFFPGNHLIKLQLTSLGV
jgi:hypothetical protein